MESSSSRARNPYTPVCRVYTCNAYTPRGGLIEISPLPYLFCSALLRARAAIAVYIYMCVTRSLGADGMQNTYTHTFVFPSPPSLARGNSARRVYIIAELVSLARERLRCLYRMRCACARVAGTNGRGGI